MKKKRAIAISPTPECICLAACCRPHWDVLYTAGHKFIVDVLEKWVEKKDVSSAIIFLSGSIADEQKVAALLKEVSTGGTRIRWFCGDENSNACRTCRSVESVNLTCGDSLTEALEGYFRPDISYGLLLEQLKDNEDLLDFIRYKVSISFMKGYDPKPVYEAVSVIARNPGKRFTLQLLNPHDAASVQNFRDAEFPQLDGKSRKIADLQRRVHKVASTELSVMVLGDTGTGKEAIAFYLHEFSPRRNKPFLPINCAALEENFLRSELFGHEKNAFTGATEQRDGLVKKAEGGTIFLDELADMPLAIQADLLRFLQTKRFRRLGGTAELKSDVRVVAASQPVISDKIKSGEFRADLYFRIAEVEINAPKLGDISEDIIRIIRSIGFRYVKGEVTPGRIFEMIDYFNAGIDVLNGYHWPGNVRELAGYVKRRLFLGDDVTGEIEAKIKTPANITAAGLKIDFSLLCPNLSPDNLINVDELLSAYVKHVESCSMGLPKKEIAAGLGLSINTYKKYLRQSG